ncbi:DUF2510 domain-containing protein [Leifsonia xyli]|uniref:DUF2510 domain-containing protein n=1 Tax=Leifsonia xyli TaxID=1575 RepID=UPI003D6742E4
MNPVPGWYADPSAPDAVRYWDGTRWTEHTAPAPAAAPAPAPVGAAGYPVQPHPTYTPMQSHQAYAPQPHYVVAVPPKNGKATRALVWGIISLFINPFALPSILAIVFGAQARRIADDMDRAGLRDTGRGRATAGLVIGIVGAALFVVWVFWYVNRN